MNFILTMILCSGVSSVCLPPYSLIDTLYEDQYSCLLKGYEKSIEIKASDKLTPNQLIAFAREHILEK